VETHLDVSLNPRGVLRVVLNRPQRFNAFDEALIAELRRQGHARTLNELLLYLQRELEQRKAVEERLAQLPRNAYPFGRLRSDLHKLGVPRAVLDSRGALGRAYAEVTREMIAVIREAGRELVAQGVASNAALDQLSAQSLRWTAIGTAQTRVIAARLAANRPATPTPPAEPKP